MNQLKEAIERVRLLRETRDAAKAAIREKTQTFLASIAGESETAKRWDTEVETAEHAATTLALAAYDADPSTKKPADGVQIKTLTKYEITDTGQAMEWCRAKELGLLPPAFDEKVLFKISDTTPLPFVRVTKVNQAQLAKDIPAPATPTTEAV